MLPLYCALAAATPLAVAAAIGVLSPAGRFQGARPAPQQPHPSWTAADDPRLERMAIPGQDWPARRRSAYVARAYAQADEPVRVLCAEAGW